MASQAFVPRIQPISKTEFNEAEKSALPMCCLMMWKLMIKYTHEWWHFHVKQSNFDAAYVNKLNNKWPIQKWCSNFI